MLTFDADKKITLPVSGAQITVVFLSSPIKSIE
jgi:hypothetical protein